MLLLVLLSHVIVFLSTQSYGGHYIPLLVKEILKHNAENPGSVTINLKGFMVGNPWTSPVHDNYGTLLFWLVDPDSLCQQLNV